ncbi:MAG: hypothetical protein ACQEWF_07775 [Bacillota bacterium]
MDLVSTFSTKGELIDLTEKLINLGLAIDDGKLNNKELVNFVAECIKKVENLNKSKIFLR